MAAVAFFMTLAIWTMLPVLADIDGVIPGTHLGDSAAGLWNVWWFTQAVGKRQNPYWTDVLFAPFGTQLSLHTHATTHSVLAWPLTSFTSVVAAHNLALLTGLALNGICVWMLSYRLTGRSLPAIVAGAIFALSAHVQLRVLGHINLVHAWVLPLFVFAVLRLEDRRRPGDALLAGAAGALVLYTDYYYAVYAALFCGVWLSVRTFAIDGSILSPRHHRLRAVLLALILVDLALIAAIGWTGGAGLEFGPVRISARNIRNPLTAVWILALLWAWLRFPLTFRLRVRRRPTGSLVRSGSIALAACLLLAAPLLVALAQIVTSGDYTAPRVLWRSSPAGGDALTLVLGHPLHVVTGWWTRSAYEALGLYLMEQSLWIGVVPIVLLLVTWRTVSEAAGARLWAAVAVVFFVLSLGPFLRVGGFDTALVLPHALLRYIPGIGNARIPGRAIVMVDLAIAVLSAMALSTLAVRSRVVSALLMTALILELLPAPTPVVRIPAADSIDQFLRTSPESGAVVELPTGVRDGFGEDGAFDHRALVHQIWHGRPLVGGFVARLSQRVHAGYSADPILMNLIDVSTPSSTNVGLPSGAARRAADLGIAYLVLNRDTAIDERLSRQSLESAGFELMQKSGPRELYVTPE
jgi:hypothetical protein